MIKRGAVSSCSPFSSDIRAGGDVLLSQEKRFQLGTGRDFPEARICLKRHFFPW